MSDWKNLPREVLHNILLYLKKSDKNITHKKDLSQCALTCRGWKDASQAVFFSDINLRGAKNDLNKLCLLLLVNNNIRLLIKNLSFDGSLKYSNDFAMLFGLDLQFPNLETLKFSGDDLLYTTFTKVVAENGIFKNLRSLPTPKDREQDQVYLQSINSLKDRITTIELFDDPTTIRNSYSDLRESLNIFPHLEEIVIYTSTKNMYSEDFMQYLEFIANKKLESLKKISIVLLRYNGYRFQLFTSGQQALFSTTEPKNIHAIIKNVVYTLPSKAFMLFIMKRFPNTNSFSLEYDFHELQGLETSSSIDLMALLLFLRYLSAMPNFLLQNIVLPNEDAFKLIKDFYTTSEEEEATSAKPLCRLKIGSVGYHPSDGIPLNSSIISFKNVNSREQNIIINLNSGNSSQNRNQSNASSLPHPSSYEVLFQQLIQQVGCLFEMINFRFPTASGLDPFFSSIVNYCPRLNELVIIAGLPHKSLAEESFIIKKKLKNTCSIKSLTLLGFTPTQKQLINLLDQLPNLERLSLTNLFLKISDPFQESFFSICLPNASLKCLEINMDSSCYFALPPNRKDHFVKINTDDPNQKTVRFYFSVYGNQCGVRGYHVKENITEDDYQYNISYLRSNSTSYLLYCKSLEKLTMRYIERYSRQWNNKKLHLLTA